MAFNLFKSKRQKLKEESEPFFEKYVAGLKEASGSEIGYVLDIAAQIKYSTTLYGADQEKLLLFEDPIRVSEEVAFETLMLWKIHMGENSGTIEGLSKVGALSIWYLSLLAMQIAELRIRGREMWGELEGGFKYCEIFDPKTDCVKGFESHFD